MADKMNSQVLNNIMKKSEVVENLPKKEVVKDTFFEGKRKRREPNMNLSFSLKLSQYNELMEFTDNNHMTIASCIREALVEKGVISDAEYNK